MVPDRSRMALISDEYRAVNRKMHETSSVYGSKGGRKWSQAVEQMRREYGGVTVLDYGCGKGSLQGENIRRYDPAVPEFSADPEPADIVLCSDVMEHVEAECIDDVLDHIRSLTLKVALFIIVCRLSGEILPDGRNAHISVHEPEWWRQKIADRFRIKSLKVTTAEVICYAEPEA